MASAKLQASSDFFKQLSLEFQQLKLILHTLETFAHRATDRGYQLEDKRLLEILEQMEIFILNVKQLHNRLESLLLMLVVTA